MKTVVKTQQSPIILNLSLREIRSGKSHGYRHDIVFEKLQFRDELVCTVSPTVEIKVCFQSSPVSVDTVQEYSILVHLAQYSAKNKCLTPERTVFQEQ